MIALTESLVTEPPIRFGRTPVRKPPALGGRGWNVTVLCGGPSPEREVSFRSGRAVAAALRSLGHVVSEADVGPSDLSALDRPELDVAFVAMHGAFGEDGTLQAVLEQRGIPYTGSGPEACRLAMSKPAAKDVLSAHGVAVPVGRTVSAIAPGTAAGVVGDLIDQLGLPVVCKPAHGGSSLLVRIAHNRAELQAGLTDILASGDSVLVEEFIVGRELTVGILGDQALPVLEARTAREFFDFAAKYQGGTEYVFETGLPSETLWAVQTAALRTHRALGCRDFSRVDVRLTPDGRPVVLELNAIPGFTERSLLPKAADQSGIRFTDLCDRLLIAALARAGRVRSC